MAALLLLVLLLLLLLLLAGRGAGLKSRGCWISRVLRGTWPGRSGLGRGPAVVVVVVMAVGWVGSSEGTAKRGSTSS